MARLTRIQLRAIFAKLKGAQTSYVRKRAKSVRIGPAQLSEVELDSVMSRPVVDKLLARLPESHRRISRMENLEILDHQLGGMYNRHVGSWTPGGKGKRKNLIRLTRKPDVFMTEVGYTDKPSHVSGGYWAYKAHSKVPLTEAARKRHTLRNARLGARKSFYHEYGHSIWDGPVDDLRYLWADHSRFEWSLSARLPFSRLPLTESFAEAYAMYAISKVSRARLKRQRPESYALMERFFNQVEGSVL